MTNGTGASDKKLLTHFRVIAESAFFMNNVKKVNSITEAYELSKNNPGTIITDQNIYKPEAVGFPKNAKVLVFNDGNVTGRSAAARRIIGEKNIDKAIYSDIAREAVFKLGFRNNNYYAQSIIGLHEDFMVKAHIIIPKNYENNLLSWLSNFQEINNEYEKMYNKSKKINENDIFIITDPEWTHPDYPMGLSLFSPEENVAFILGMRYFGEFKKGTLALAWGIADRNGYASCHGGLKSFDDKNYVCAFFGLSGSGKSTLTHAKHQNKYKVTILHDDALAIDVNTHESIALEPSYFDKTSDYQIDAEDNKFIMTAQNVGVTLNEKGEKILVTEDIRNANGRAVKSRLWSPNRVDKISKKINAIFWLMKDPSIPAILKINKPSLASALGATLATKRTSAERLSKDVDANALVFEPYANPFRTYPLKNDYLKFKTLFEKGVSCYILNTGHFLETKVTAKTTLGLIEQLIEKDSIKLKSLFGSTLLDFSLGQDIAEPDLKEWKKLFVEQMKKRSLYAKSLDDRNQLPADALESIEELICQIQG